MQPQALLQSWMALNRKAVRLAEYLSHVRDEDIEIGTAPKTAVYRNEKLTLYRYSPVAKRLLTPPLLIAYALVNRPYMVDLQPDRSLVRNLLKLGVDVYLIDWGYPGPIERWLTLDDYINGYIDGCIDAIRAEHKIEKVNLLGICQGGTLSLCYAALHPEKVKNLITMVTPVDFHVPATASCGLLNTWCRYLDAAGMVSALGNIPGDFMNFGYLMLRPFALTTGKYMDLLDAMLEDGEDEQKIMNFLRMEKWIFDSPAQAGEAWRQFIEDFYQGNKLVKGELEIGGRRVDLGRIAAPVLNIYAAQDHLVPPASSMALERYIGGQDYSLRSFPVGHIGMYVSGKVQKDLPSLIAEWLQTRRGESPTRPYRSPAR